MPPVLNVTYNIDGTATTEQVWPCRCGETHRGEHAVYDYAHHNCFHGPLWPMDEPGAPVEQMMCAQCGEVFDVERKKTAPRET